MQTKIQIFQFNFLNISVENSDLTCKKYRQKAGKELSYLSNGSCFVVTVVLIICYFNSNKTLQLAKKFAVLVHKTFVTYSTTIINSVLVFRSNKKIVYTIYVSAFPNRLLCCAI